jgi:menaquinone-dependent protoporphyrinogen oxidase
MSGIECLMGNRE